jgi:sterol desaturase/sphingolipid hydroxylase (fatty acid hydroxylase superfamily)
MDLTVAAVPVYFGTMGVEHWWLRRGAAQRGPTAGDYEPNDTRTSLAMGVLSLAAPMVAPKVLGRFVPGKGKYGKALVAAAAGAAVVTTVADRLRRWEDHEEPRRRRVGRAARKVASVGGVVAVAAGGTAVTTTWASRSTMDKLWRHRILPDLGTGTAGWLAAILGWDFVYYWNHRFMHTSRYMWAIHVVHHSSERYNLSTALRQPVADAFGTFVPYGVLGLFGVRPALISQARGINLLYQYWIHTETIRSLGPLEKVLNTASHHRVHHGSNQQYLDRNHGSILIVWDRLFGTFEPEDETVVYGLTKNIGTFNPARVATHEHASMFADVARSQTWRDRVEFVLRGPGWAYARHAQAAAAAGRLTPAA